MDTDFGVIVIGGALTLLVVGVMIVFARRDTSATSGRSQVAGWGSSIEALPADDAQLPPILTRSYRGGQATATALYAQDAAQLAARGYVPTGQAYIPGQWSGGAFLGALLLILFVGLGILILLYMLVRPPAGTLTVTYQRQQRDPYSAPARQVFPVGPTG
jgi:hypothetical protein